MNCNISVSDGFNFAMGVASFVGMLALMVLAVAIVIGVSVQVYKTFK